MSGYPDSVPESVPQSPVDRAAFVKHRYLQYKDALLNGEPGRLSIDRARPIADELARGDLLSLLGRFGERARRIQQEFEDLNGEGHSRTGGP